MVDSEKERHGWKFEPVHVDIGVEFQAINEINLNEEYFDATIVLKMSWVDKELQWHTIHGGIRDKNLKSASLNLLTEDYKHENNETHQTRSIRVSEDQVLNGS